MLLKGVNVGGHRTFRPSVLAKQLRHVDAVSIGAAGSFVIRRRVNRARLRSEISRRLPFEADIMICDGGEVLRLVDADPFFGQPVRPDIVRFVSVLARRRAPSSQVPLTLPPRGRWSLKALECRGRFVLGLYRREMKAIGYLGQLEQFLGVSITTRNWTTMMAIAQLVKRGTQP